MSDEPIVQFQHVSKSFGSNLVLRDLDLDIYPGHIIGLLGANASGKSTLLRHIVGLYLPTGGECYTLGVPARKLGARELSRVGYVHQEGALLEWMTAQQLLRYVGAYYETWDSELEDRFVRQFEVPLNAKVATLSPGKRQQLAVLIAIGFKPDLLILDEPAAAMDTIARMDFLDMLLEYIQEPGRTIIISSHILSDVEKIIDHAIIVKNGQIARNCSFDDLREEFTRVRLTSLNGSELPPDYPFPNIIDIKRNEKQASLIIQRPDPDALQSLAREINCAADLSPLSLEEIYRIVVSGKSN